MAHEAPRVQQPKPQALASRNTSSSILVSPRQRGNPILNSIRAVPWEYSDIVPDYTVGATTCALFLSLKYHRLHPEYIYSRIKALAGKYNLRILLVMVDIENHEEALRELSKTSLINNVTIMLCWSAQEAGRYLELYKTYEHAAPTSIRAHQATNYSEKLVEFITTPRSINKTDAVSLVSNFGSLRTAINAHPEEVALVAGWGDKKVQRWCNSVREPFRNPKASKKSKANDAVPLNPARQQTQKDSPDPRVAARLGIGSQVPLENESTTATDASRQTSERPPAAAAASNDIVEPGEDEEEALLEAQYGVAPKPSAPTSKPGAPSNMAAPSNGSKPNNKRKADEPLSEGIEAALAKLRNQ
ncbi:restriction endonuclease type II-like protein [Phyllosticta citrichinensis]|uniref:Restriction endonuclease type II-like protein n=1 Tax=Phyllosticta citrichinensis TaxID=1130410 RepID=A0ABR1XU47_9PEZI